MTTLDLDTLEKLEREATDAPWSGDRRIWCRMPSHGTHTLGHIYEGYNGQFIAALRNAAPALIARARRADELEAENERLREENAWMQEAGTEMAREITGRDDAMFHYDPPL